MGHENVGQLEMLSRITGDQIRLIADIQNPTIAILGVANGNGLSLFKAGQCKTIIGMDINEAFLDICRHRYRYLPELKLYKIDLMVEKDRAADILRQVDLVIANLLVKHIHLNNFIDIVCQLTNPTLSVTIQFDPDGIAVSHSGYETAFDTIQCHGQDCDEGQLTDAMFNIGYKQINRIVYELPNQKLFIRLDYKRSDVM